MIITIHTLCTGSICRSKFGLELEGSAAAMADAAVEAGEVVAYHSFHA